MIELRPYQREAVDAIFDYWSRGGGNPLVDLATGLGKSLVIASLTREVLQRWPDMRVLNLVHVRELVEQDFKAMMHLWPQAPVGINSAGLGRRDRRSQILFASIQSVYRDPSIGDFDLVLIDESHLVPQSGEGMYRKLIERLRGNTPDLRVAGLTATPFRLDSGRLDNGDERLFDEIVYSYDIAAGIADGWLSPLISKASATEIDVSNVVRRGGEFVAGSLEAAADRENLTAAASAEIARYGAERRSWLIFCSGVDHAYHVRDALRGLGIHTETVTGDTPAGERARLIRDFRDGRIRCLTNAQVLTTGFDAPGVDLIVFLRPTLSTGLYLQMVGRGVRVAPDKADCLVLDFAGNVRRHGPVDAIVMPDRMKREVDPDAYKTAIDTVRAKTCPQCESLVGVATVTCKYCGYEWPVELKHEAEADDLPILSTERKNMPELMPVVSWQPRRWPKEGAPDTLRVTYFAGLASYHEWLCFEHKGFMRDKAERWWRRHGGGAPPATVAEAINRFDVLTMPSHISVRKNPKGKWWDVVARRFAGQTEVAA
jgi:DNA repair protein RadD